MRTEAPDPRAHSYAEHSSVVLRPPQLVRSRQSNEPSPFGFLSMLSFSLTSLALSLKTSLFEDRWSMLISFAVSDGTIAGSR